MQGVESAAKFFFLSPTWGEYVPAANLQLINLQRISVSLSTPSLWLRTQPAEDNIKNWLRYGLHKALDCAQTLLIYLEENRLSMVCRADKPTDGFMDGALVLYKTVVAMSSSVSLQKVSVFKHISCECNLIWLH